MPAASEPGVPALPHTWRPVGVRVVGIALGLALVVICAAAWFTFDAETRARFTFLQRATLVGIGVLAFGVMHALTRSRVVATRERLVVVNGYRRRELEWAQVVGVHLPAGAPWVTLDLADGSTLPAMGIQGSDGGSARRAARQLRALVDAPPAPPAPPA
ncbi:PH domain-containing protein [Nocardioides sp. SYSU D00038]|uniref:PH domain-containing protein n=1 Tax=Nocardioides sp. SYSU D00038 TaxID=2812554 RepID=UPI00196884DE|nr:PH domain-containing protein [Nocardioides sp. SYSU D00038]